MVLMLLKLGSKNMYTNIELVKSEVINAQKTYWTFSTDGHMRDDIALVDTVNIIEALDWCDDGTAAIYDEYFDTLEKVYTDNTYNFSGKVSSDINWETAKTVSGYVTRAMFHLGGDMRTNYTKYLYFEHDSSEGFIIAVNDVEGNEVEKKVDDIEIYFLPWAFTQGIDVYCPKYDCGTYCYDFEITDELANDVLQEMLEDYE